MLSIFFPFVSFISSSRCSSRSFERSWRPSGGSGTCSLWNWPVVSWCDRSFWGWHVAAGCRPRGPEFGYKLPFWHLLPLGPCNCLCQCPGNRRRSVSLISAQRPKTKRNAFLMCRTVQEINRCSRFSCARSFVNWYCLLWSIHPESPYVYCHMLS